MNIFDRLFALVEQFASEHGSEPTSVRLSILDSIDLAQELSRHDDKIMRYGVKRALEGEQLWGLVMHFGTPRERTVVS
jgi:hypothetical protein